jgi:hypothetical protein
VYLRYCLCCVREQHRNSCCLHITCACWQQISKVVTDYPAIQPYDTLLMELLPSNVIRGVAQASAAYQSQAITYHSNVQDSESSSTYSEQLSINSTGTCHTIQYNTHECACYQNVTV